MGFNSAILIHNDELSKIGDDKNFGKLVHDAICYHVTLDKTQPYHRHGIQVITQHHANHTAAVLIGGNQSKHLGFYKDLGKASNQDIIDILKDIAIRYGYRLHKVPEAQRKKLWRDPYDGSGFCL